MFFQVFFNGANVRQVDVPTQTGAFGILAAHVPTLQVLRPGLVVVHAEDGTTSKYFGACTGTGLGGATCFSRPKCLASPCGQKQSPRERPTRASSSLWWVRVSVGAGRLRGKPSPVAEEPMERAGAGTGS